MYSVKEVVVCKLLLDVLVLYIVTRCISVIYWY